MALESREGTRASRRVEEGAGRDWGQEEKGTTEDRWLDGITKSMDMSLSLSNRDAGLLEPPERLQGPTPLPETAGHSQTSCGVTATFSWVLVC